MPMTPRQCVLGQRPRAVSGSDIQSRFFISACLRNTCQGQGLMLRSSVDRAMNKTDVRPPWGVHSLVATQTSKHHR